MWNMFWMMIFYLNILYLLYCTLKRGVCEIYWYYWLSTTLDSWKNYPILIPFSDFNAWLHIFHPYLWGKLQTEIKNNCHFSHLSTVVQHLIGLKVNKYSQYQIWTHVIIKKTSSQHKTASVVICDKMKTNVAIHNSIDWRRGHSRWYEESFRYD